MVSHAPSSSTRLTDGYRIEIIGRSGGEHSAKPFFFASYGISIAQQTSGVSTLAQANATMSLC
jgi:hypothetical protein